MTTTQQPEENNSSNLLGRFERKAIDAHNWTSFNPERRRQQMIKDYSEELAADLEELKVGGAGDESVSDYKGRYEKYFSSYFGAKSNCFSVMITGGSGFNNRKHAKANRSEERHYEIFREWRLRAKKAIIRKAQPVKTYTSELERYRAELAGMQRNHETMKACNVIIKKAKGKDCTSDLIAAGLSEVNARKIQLPDFAGRIGFASFSLTNNNANMKRIEGMIKTLESKEAAKAENSTAKYSFEGGEFIVNYEVDRIQIFFATRPSREELDGWKAKGLNTFNWSPSATAWQRKITPNAFACVKRMFERIAKVEA